MFAEDNVLVAYLPEPQDFELIKQYGWYRLPYEQAPKGIYADYIAFYFGRNFGPQKWSIHYFAERRGFELVRRLDLLPQQSDHPRAQALYYKLQLGPLHKRPEPIVSLRWHRVTFFHTTWDRFCEAREIGDLLLDGGDYVNRQFYTLKEGSFAGQNCYSV